MKLSRLRATVTSGVVGVLLLAAGCGSEPVVASNTTSVATSAAVSEEATSETANTEQAPGTGSGDVTLDETTIAWFDSFCTALKPVVELGSQTPPSEADLEAAKATGTALVDAGNKLADELTTLSGLDAPTFEGGDELASTAVTALTEASDAFIQFGGELETGDVSGAQEFGNTLGASPLANLGSLSSSPEFAAVPTQVPACAAIQ